MKKATAGVLLCLLLILGACSFEDEPSPCPYNVRLEYWYAGSGVENLLPRYVDQLRQYIFDSEGNLIEEATLHGTEVAGWSGTLPDGTYTFVLWGNLGNNPASRTQNVLPAGSKQCNEMLLSAQQEGVPPGFRENTSRLYYGTTQLTIADGVTQRQRVYFSHAHAELSVTVRWMTEQPTEGAYRMRLKGVPAVYGFTGGRQETVPSGDGTYTLPRIDRPVTYHETAAAMNYEGEVLGQFVTFRYTTSSHLLWSLWKGGKQVVRELDLYLFFNKLPMNMATNMEQVFDLLVTVYDDKIVVSQVSSVDWDEGGGIG